jgi:hypothetical protein
MNDLLAEEEQQAPSGGRGKEASGRRDDQGNRSPQSGNSTNLPKGNKLPGGKGKTKSQGVSTNSNVTAGQNPAKAAGGAGAPGMKTAGAAQNLLRGGASNAVNNAEQLAKEATKELAKEAAKKAAMALAANPLTWVAVGIILIILFILYLFLGDDAQKQQQGPQANPLQATFACNPAQAAVGQTSVCTLHLVYPGSAENVTASVSILAGGQYVSSAPTGTVNTADPNNQMVSWDAKLLNLPLTAPIDETYTVTVKTTVDNKTIPITYTANVLNGSLAGGGGGNASDNDCGGKYRALMDKNRFLKKNFGDPTCDPALNKDAIFNYFKTKDAANADWWFQVAKCESTYEPNLWRDPDTTPHTPDAGGAWGLLQTGSSIIATPETLYSGHKTRGSVQPSNLQQQPGMPGGTWGHGGEFDRGDVDWKTQIDNAVQLLPRRGKAYWSCA